MAPGQQPLSGSAARLAQITALADKIKRALASNNPDSAYQRARVLARLLQVFLRKDAAGDAPPAVTAAQQLIGQMPPQQQNPPARDKKREARDRRRSTAFLLQVAELTQITKRSRANDYRIAAEQHANSLAQLLDSSLHRRLVAGIPSAVAAAQHLIDEMRRQEYDIPTAEERHKRRFAAREQRREQAALQGQRRTALHERRRMLARRRELGIAPTKSTVWERVATAANPTFTSVPIETNRARH